MKKLALILLALTLTSIGNADADQTHHRRMPVPPSHRPTPPVAHPPLQEIVRLGSAKLGSAKGANFIRVNTCAANEELRAELIRISAVDRAVGIRQITVLFANGMSSALRTAFFLQKGQQTPWIDLRGRGRCVRAVRILGDRSTLNQDAEVEVFGLRKWRTQLDLQDRREEL